MSLLGGIVKTSHALSLRALLTTRALTSNSSPSLEVMSDSSAPLEQSIRAKLTALLHPTELTISNDSWQHRHHAAMRAQGGGHGETHFSVSVVSDTFKGKTTMQRHRMIYAALSDEFAAGLHALSLKTKTEQEVANFTA